jgi:hypothetical protein
MHEKDTALHLGAAETIEWDKTSSAFANADANEDGLPFVQILTSSGNYYTDLDVYNNSGSNATVCAWVDFDGNGIFDLTEGITKTISSSPATQRIQLFWTGVTSTLSNNSYTYLRVRITSASNGMTIANSTGYYYNGEVEDYYVPVNTVALAVKLKYFSVQKKDEQEVDLRWEVGNDAPGTRYEVQRSTEGRTWQAVDQKIATTKGDVTYHSSDFAPSKPSSYYRVAFTDASNKTCYSEIKKIDFPPVQSLSVYPNPTSEACQVQVSAAAGHASLQLRDANGKVVFKQDIVLKQGKNSIALPGVNTWGDGVYTVYLSMAGNVLTTKLIIRR